MRSAGEAGQMGMLFQRGGIVVASVGAIDHLLLRWKDKASAKIYETRHNRAAKSDKLPRFCIYCSVEFRKGKFSMNNESPLIRFEMVTRPSSENGGAKWLPWIPSISTLIAVLAFLWVIHQDLAGLNRDIGNIKGTLEGIEKNVDRLWDRVTSLEKDGN